jgi:hypothetical protein
VPFSIQNCFVRISANDRWYIHTASEEAFQIVRKEYDSFGPSAKGVLG